MSKIPGNQPMAIAYVADETGYRVSEHRFLFDLLEIEHKAVIAWGTDEKYAGDYDLAFREAAWNALPEEAGRRIKNIVSLAISAAAEQNALNFTKHEDIDLFFGALQHLRDGKRVPRAIVPAKSIRRAA